MEGTKQTERWKLRRSGWRGPGVQAVGTATQLGDMKDSQTLLQPLQRSERQSKTKTLAEISQARGITGKARFLFQGNGTPDGMSAGQRGRDWSDTYRLWIRQKHQRALDRERWIVGQLTDLGRHSVQHPKNLNLKSRQILGLGPEAYQLACRLCRSRDSGGELVSWSTLFHLKLNPFVSRTFTRLSLFERGHYMVPDLENTKTSPCEEWSGTNWSHVWRAKSWAENRDGRL